MKTAIMKFGGSSLADPGRIRRAAATVLAARRRGLRPVAVVSAPADCTDDLLKLAALTGPQAPSKRELDALMGAGEQFSAALLALALQHLGARAVSLTGLQAGIRTNRAFSSAKVLRVAPARLKHELSAGLIPVVAGFQGATSAGDTTTLGRGGSDLTAVMLARALGSSICEFYTDVRGIYSAHPAIVPDAVRLEEISYGEVLKLAGLGTEVRQLRAIEYAEKHKLRLALRSSFHDDPGTTISSRPSGPGVTCLSLSRHPHGALVSLIGSRLGTADAARAAAVADRLGARAEPAARSACTLSLLTGAADGERLLRALHTELIH